MAYLARQLRCVCHLARRHCRPLSTEATPSPSLDEQTGSSQGWSFELTDEQREMQSLARKFAREEIMPREMEYDKSGEFPWDLTKKAWELGLMNTSIPQAYGGPGVSLFDACMMTEELSYACAAIQTSIEANSLAHWPLIVSGSEELKKKYLGWCTKEPILTAYAITEAGGGSDVAGIRTKAEKKADKYILNGEKMWISNGGVASWYYVLARTHPDPKTPTNRAFTGFIVEKDWPGVTPSKKLWNMGLRSSDTRGIAFEDVEVPAENVVGVEGQGFLTAMKTFDKTRPLSTGAGLGVAQRCLEDAVKYATERVTFGKPIIQHQMITSLLADMAAAVEAARLVNQRACWMSDQGEKNTYYASLAKLLMGQAAYSNATNCLQIYGSYGFNTEYPVEKHLRDAKIFSIYEGTEQIQKLIIGRELVSKYK